MRTLYYVKPPHSPEEITWKQPFLNLLGHQTEKIYREKVNKFWQRFQNTVVEKKFNTPTVCQKLHIYVDGLPVEKYLCKNCFTKTEKRSVFMDEIDNDYLQCPACPHRVKKPNSLSDLINYRIEMRLPPYVAIEKLLKKGAHLHGTESIILILEEQQMWDEAAKGVDPDQQKKNRLLKERDEFVARQINQTLPENEIGLLFTGAYHHIDQELKRISDIQLAYIY
ncbi:hypothetical protein MYX07_04525 [Patescibacteria group bacterium AH-259-L07]|nr:hypothetical protein [Patescibacteria group bacterium AH-259-L07]